MKTCVKCKKNFKKNDMDKSNPCEKQATHFIDYVESLNITNSTHNCKNVNITYGRYL